MYTALRATSRTLAKFLETKFQADPLLGGFFGGGMVVSLNTPQEMIEKPAEGLSLWLYRVIRDDQRLNDPPVRISPTELQAPPLPIRLHYLVTPITNQQNGVPETEQLMLGKVLQLFHSHPKLRGFDLQAEFSGTEVELNVRLEPMPLEEITRVWEALEGSYQLSVSYEVSVVNIASENEPQSISPVQVAMPEFGIIVGSEPST
jgi:Pvc16 N-terminal domain